MVQGLAFLSKKSWHTKNLANQEKVWIAEQRKAAEETKTKELARQIQQEREREEFDKLAGKKTHMDRGIDWMYQGQAATAGGDGKPSALEEEDAARKAEEYLLGKEFNGEGAAKGDFAQGGHSEGVNAVVKLEPRGASAAAAATSTASMTNAAESTVADRNEAFRQRVEDPMFMVSQKERLKNVEARKQHALFERVMGPTTANNSDHDEEYSRRGKKKKKSKQHRKERKHERKRSSSKKRHHRRRHHDDDDSEDSYDSKKEEEEDHHKRHRRHASRKYDSDSDSEREDRRRHKRRKRSRSRDRDRDDRKRSHRSSRRRSRSRSYSPDDTRLQNRTFRDRGGGGGGGRSDRDYDKKKDDHHQHHHERDGKSAKISGYGLQGGGGRIPSSSYSSSKDLGPNQDLLHQKRKAAEEERRRAKARASNRRTMTPEERAKALQEMQATAEARTQQTDLQKKVYGQEEDDDTHKNDNRQGNASFLQDMRQQTHGIINNAPSNHKSMAARMAENRNTQQRLHDDSFL